MKAVFLILIINSLLFLPRYLLRLPKHWNPFSFFFTKAPLKDKVKSLYYSRIIDPFRISMEYTIPVLILLIIGFSNTTLIYCCTVIAVVIFIFNVYAGIFLYLFHQTPILKSDFLFIKDSIPFYKGSFVLITFAFLVLMILVGYLFFYLTNTLFSLGLNPIIGSTLLLLMLVNGLVNVKHFRLKNYLARTVFSLTVFIFKSNKQSKVYESLYKLKKADIQKLNLFTDIKLKTKPNIHIISMESYGSILFKNQESYADVRSSLANWAEKFEKSDIQVTSSYAIPPLFATGTWYSYSTLLFGMVINVASQYNMLFSEMKNFDAYESLFQFTKREGYTNFFLQGITGEFDSTLDFGKLKKNLNYDHLLYNTDLDYHGQYLKFMKLQNCVPDQYTFNKGLDIVKKHNKPYTLFWPTLNAHYDFNAPVAPVANLEDLNHPDFKFSTTMDGKLNKYERYEIAIKYTIDVIFDTILKRLGPNDIFIVYGDHQPTMIAEEKYGLETPMHIFSKNQQFQDEWKKFGFNNGLLPTAVEDGKYLRFEAFYSTFMNCLNKIYGEDVELEIPVMEHGVSLE